MVNVSKEPSTPDTLHTPDPLVASTVKTTGWPDAPPVADRVIMPPAVPAAGGANEIACESRSSP